MANERPKQFEQASWLQRTISFRQSEESASDFYNYLNSEVFIAMKLNVSRTQQLAMRVALL